MKLLIDADYIVYKSCAGAETEIDFGEDLIMVTSLFSDAMKAVKNELNKIKKEFFDPELILFFSDSRNFRKDIYPNYKGHRNRKKPCGYKRVVHALAEDYQTVVYPELEADDTIGIYATSHEDCVIVSPDKDMRQIPGQLWDMKDEMFTITKEEGRQWHFIQTLAGDQTDGYAGAPGYGVKTAAKLFEKDGYYWETIVEAFESKGLTEEDALTNARLAKILQVEDYNYDIQKPRRWNPAPSDHRPHTGTGVSAKED